MKLRPTYLCAPRWWLMALVLVGCASSPDDGSGKAGTADGGVAGSPPDASGQPRIVDAGASGSGSQNPHEISPSADDGGICYPGFDPFLSCSEAFVAVSACETEADVTLLREGLEAVTDEGCYYFCPDVEDCADLSPNEVATLLCRYAATHDISASLGLRPLCGPVATTHGPCCFGIDAVTYYN